MGIVPGEMADARGWRPFATAPETSLSVATVNRRGRAPSNDLPPDSTVADEVADEPLPAFRILRQRTTDGGSNAVRSAMAF